MTVQLAPGWLGRSRGRRIALILTLVAGAAHAQALPSAIVWRDVTPGHWQWLEDYGYFMATYVLGCPRDRKCRIGTGLFIMGSPRGSQKDFSGDIEVTVFGLGALHVRIEDGTTPARVGFYQRSNMLIPIYPPPGAGLLPPAKPSTNPTASPQAPAWMKPSVQKP